FADVGVLAAAMGIGAVVVDVLALLALGRDGAAAPGARQQAHERVLLLGIPRARALREHGLGRVEQVAADDRLVAAGVLLPIPHQVAVVDRVAERAVQLRLEQAPASSGMRQADGVRFGNEAFSEKPPLAYS